MVENMTYNSSDLLWAMEASENLLSILLTSCSLHQEHASFPKSLLESWVKVEATSREQALTNHVRCEDPGNSIAVQPGRCRSLVSSLTSYQT